jgi:hypothetical protein
LLCEPAYHTGPPKPGKCAFIPILKICPPGSAGTQALAADGAIAIESGTVMVTKNQFRQTAGTWWPESCIPPP